MEMGKPNVKFDIASIIFKAYYNATRILYSTIVSDSEATKMIKESLQNDKPFNIGDNKKANVYCSIKTDVEVLNAISKIITIMATSNQCLLQAPSLNGY